MSSTQPTSSEVKAFTPSPVVTLAGKVAIITGASRGIGAGIAATLARDGAKVIVNYQKDKAAADSVVAAIVSSGGTATAVQADAASSADVDRLFAETKRLYGRVDIVVANAGIISTSMIATETNAAFDRLLDVNIKGVFYALRAAANIMENHGRIIVLGSIGKVGMETCGSYATTKAGVEALANTAAKELGSRGITVNTIHPGAIDTDMLASFADADRRAHMAAATPMGRIGTVADLADAVSLFVSDSARWITGQSIFVTGGQKT